MSDPNREGKSLRQNPGQPVQNGPSLPHNLDAEQALLGALLFNNRLFARLPALSSADFFDPAHGRIFATIARLIRADRLADATTLRETFDRDGGLQEIGGAVYLLTLLENAARLSVHAIEYAESIHDLAIRRAIVARAYEIAGLALNAEPDAEINDLLIGAQRAFSEIGESASALEDEWKSAGEIAHDAVERAYKGEAKGISTGLEALDECTGGGRPGSLWVIGGATSMGKSVAGQQFAVNVAKQGYGVAYVHLEMDRDEVGLRLASALAYERASGRNPYYLSAANQKLRDDQWERMRTAARQIAPSLQIYVDDRPGRTVTQIEAATQRLFQKMRRDGVTPGLIVVDHEGLIAPEAKHPSELEAARARSLGLKNMAKRSGVWTIALSQITKEGSRADGEDRLPTSQDLNYGSALSQAAHVVILLHRPAYFEARRPHALNSGDDGQMPHAKTNDATLIVDKARGGQRKQVSAAMDVASAVLFDPRRA